MQKAAYSSNNLGHFGLGFSEYTHFTSPIRRYSDIIVHRIIKKSLKNQNSIYEIIDHCNKGEIVAQNAEREYKTLKSLKWLKNKDGETLEDVRILTISPFLSIVWTGISLPLISHPIAVSPTLV